MGYTDAIHRRDALVELNNALYACWKIVFLIISIDMFSESTPFLQSHFQVHTAFIGVCSAYLPHISTIHSVQVHSYHRQRQRQDPYE